MGSKIGWILAGALILGLVLIVLFVVVFPPASSPTAETMGENFMQLKTISLSPAVVVAFESTGAGNAGDDYHEAVTIHQANAEGIGRFVYDLQAIAKGDTAAEAATIDILNKIDAHISAGSRKAKMQYTFVHTPKKFKVGYNYKPAEALFNVSEAMDALATYYFAKNKYEDAWNVLCHEFVMGRHMMDERSRPDMVYLGVFIQTKSLDGLMDIRSKWDGAKDINLNKFKQYACQLSAVRNSYEQKLKIVWNTRPEPGDVFHVIKADQDRAWRVQGLLSLGILKFTAVKRGDLRQTDKLIEKYLTSSDPLEAAAAAAARDLDTAGFNRLGVEY
ncbi:MAG: hypothetical protein SVT52_08850 [Planctomycetota bacterium]|nr:hypothetical protein [Planctomycetota bacterium]